MTDVPPDGQPAAVTPVRDDAAILAKLDAWNKDADQHWRDWRVKARESYGFVASDQWSKDERTAAEDAERLITTINRIGPMVNAVAGAEILDRQQVQYIARSLEDGGVNEVLTKGADWIRDQTSADREESEAFRDVLICGLGYTETVMSYEEEPEGRVVIGRIDPLEVTPDPSARKSNLTDARFLRRRRKIALADFESLYPHAAPAGDNITGALGKSGGNRRRAYKDRGDKGTEDFCNDDEVMLTEWQWYDLETRYAAVDPGTKAVSVLTKAERDQLEAAYAQQGQEFRSVPQRKRLYRRAITCGEQLLEYDPLPDNEFTIKVITGERDRNKGTWFGLVEAMKDPQRFANLFFSMLHHIIRTNAKGGIMAEEDAFEDVRKAEDTWAKSDAITFVKSGSLSGGKIKDKAAPQIPPVIGQLMSFAVQGIRDASGINEEMLGLAERDQPGVLEHQRKQAAYAILAGYYDSLRAYRHAQGRLLLKYMQKYLPEGYLVRIVGEDGVAKYVGLARQPDTAKFDVIVDDAPAGPQQRERTWGLIVQMSPMLKEIGPEIWAELVKYSPFPEPVIQKIVAILKQQTAQPPVADGVAKAKADRDQAAARLDMARAAQTETETASAFGVPAI